MIAKKNIVRYNEKVKLSKEKNDVKPYEKNYFHNLNFVELYDYILFFKSNSR